ncbi:MAG: TonB-dependent receptor [Bacteroidales bacterium]|nr:TonB-dependent receptor [Candidatus Physcousia equi]
MKKIAIALLALATTTQFRAQDDNEFQRIASRVMSSYENGNDSVRETHNNAHFTGRTYMGASTRGNAMPSAYFTLKSNKWLFTGDLSADLGRHNTWQEIDTRSVNGTSDYTESKTEMRFEHVNASLRYDYKPRRYDIFSIGVLETFSHTNSEMNATKYAFDEAHKSLGEEYEEQLRDEKNTKVGGLLQYKRLIPAGGSFIARANIRHFTQRTLLESEEWGEGDFDVKEHVTQRIHNFAPYIYLDYSSPTWHGFSLSANEKLSLSNLHIEDSYTQFNYDSRAALTSLSLRHRSKKLTLAASADYEHYHHLIHDGLNDDIRRSYNDWQTNLSATYQVDKNHRLRANYRRSYQRPSYAELYPFVHIGRNIGVWVVGNPQLQPSTTHTWKLDYTYNSRHWTVTAIGEYSQKNNDITRISLYDETLHRSVKTWVNDADYHTIRLALEGEMRYGRFSMTMGAHAKYLTYNGERISGDEAWSYSFKARPQLKLHNQWTLALTALYTGKEVHRYYYERPNTYISLRAVKEFGPWGIYAFVQDIFEGDRSNVTKNTDNTILTTNHPNARSLIMGCSYTF